jgi:hypothetical protein
MTKNKKKRRVEPRQTVEKKKNQREPKGLDLQTLQQFKAS